MENRSHAIAAGLFVVVVAALLVGMAMWMTRDVAHTVSYEMVSSETISGLQVQAPVRYKGVSVGKVTAIGFDPDDRSDVLVRIAVAPDTPITASTFATLAYQGITGLSFVQLDDRLQSTERPRAGPNGVPRIPLRAGALGQLTDMADELTGKISRIADRFDTLLSAENRQMLLEAIREFAAAAANTARLTDTAEQILRAQLDPARADLPRLIEQATATLQRAEQATDELSATLRGVQALTGRAQGSLEHLTGQGGTLQQLDRSADAFANEAVPAIARTASDARRTLGRIDSALGALEDNPQALLYGEGRIPPGPGEPGFTPPAPSR